MLLERTQFLEVLGVPKHINFGRLLEEAVLLLCQLFELSVLENVVSSNVHRAVEKHATAFIWLLIDFEYAAHFVPILDNATVTVCDVAG